MANLFSNNHLLHHRISNKVTINIAKSLHFTMIMNVFQVKFFIKRKQYENSNTAYVKVLVILKMYLFYMDRSSHLFEYKKMFKCLKWLLSYGMKALRSVRYKLFFVCFVSLITITGYILHSSSSEHYLILTRKLYFFLVPMSCHRLILKSSSVFAKK